MLGGWRRSLVVSFVAGVTYGVAFLPPVGRFRLGLTEDVFVLLTFEVTAVVIGVLAGRRERRHEPDDVLRAVSHDLRTPLSTIRTASADLLTGVHTDESQRAELLGLVVSESERLDRIVGNLLSVSRTRAGALLPMTTPQPLGALLHTSAQRLERVGAPPIAIELEPGLPDVPVDEIQLDQVITNLVDNATRHAGGAPITISARRSPGGVTITVRDRGPGFSAEARRHAFEPFRSTDGSSGIGLSVCRAIVEGHHGTIELIDANGEPGAAVRVTLPLAR